MRIPCSQRQGQEEAMLQGCTVLCLCQYGDHLGLSDTELILSQFSQKFCPKP